MDWYEEFFEGDWLYVHRHMWDAAQTDRQVQGIRRLLALQPRSRILDVPCGEGRHSIGLGAAGFHVTGIDRSEALLADARRNAEAAHVDLDLRQGDMRDIAEEDIFDAALNMWGSFGYFDDRGNEDFATAVCRALKRRGKLLIDTHTVESLMPQFAERGWHEVAGVKVLEERRYDDRNGRIESTWTIIRDGHESMRHASIRLYSLPELRRLLERAGFDDVRACGSLDGEAFAPGARRAYIVAEKR